jgi:phage shock protein PspC (stress-responsive transcriptional regulator)
MASGPTRRLNKSASERMLFGVAGGIAEYFDADPALVRVGFVVLSFFGGSGLIMYVALAILMPEPAGAGGTARSEADQRRTRNIAIVVVVVGVLLLAGNFGIFSFGRFGGFPWWGLFWPATIIAFGIVLVIVLTRHPRPHTRGEAPAVPGDTTSPEQRAATAMTAAAQSAGTVPNATLDRVGSVLLRALDGLTVEQLRRQPAGLESNPVGWMTWHLSRVHDMNFSNLLGREQAWVEERWYERFGLTAETGTGGRSTLDEVRAFDPVDAATLLGYWEVARARSRRFLDDLKAEDVDKPTPERPGSQTPPETYRVTIARVTSDTSQHIGQVAYARGLVDRHGWYGA